jgi:hypothetical protein
MTKEIVSVYKVIDYKTNSSYIEFVNGSGQQAIKFLRGQYPRFTKFLLEGFEIDGDFKPAELY